MNSLREIGAIILHWLDRVAAAIVAVGNWLTFPPTVRLVEDENGNLAVQSGKDGTSDPERLQATNGRFADAVPKGVAATLRGSRTELVLQSKRFLFRPLELPARASEFLDGVVRSQIDRLTPWSAADASFGWTKPVPSGPDRIAITVAATPRAQVLDFTRALSELGARSIVVSTLLPDVGDGSAPIKVLDQQTQHGLDPARVRRILAAVLLFVALLAGGSIISDSVIGSNLAAQQDDLARRLAQRRAAIRTGGTAALTPLGKLEQRKHETPSSVIVIEALSQILPDHTYVTELRIEGDKMRVTGFTHDAPSLIRLIEETPHFTRATFFAPTTRQPSDPGERFHIEARIEPVFTPQS